MRLNQLLTALLLVTLFSCQSKEVKMSLTSDKINLLDSLRSTYKFTDEDWDKRGLVPSDKSRSDTMDTLLNNCLYELVDSQRVDLTSTDCVRILNKGLKSFDQLHIDTGEKAFIADKFHEIANIIGLDYNENLDIWLYGRYVHTLEKLFKQKEAIILDSINIQCVKCQDTLTLGVVATQEDIPEYWTIAKCNRCGELNLFPAEGKLKETRFLNCSWIKSCAKAEFDSAQIDLQLSELKMIH